MSQLSATGDNLTTSFSVNSTLTMKCKQGLRLIDGTTEKTLKCQNDGLWNDSISDCGGKQ